MLEGGEPRAGEGGAGGYMMESSGSRLYGRKVSCKREEMAETEMNLAVCPITDGQFIGHYPNEKGLITLCKKPKYCIRRQSQQSSSHFPAVMLGSGRECCIVLEREPLQAAFR
ncbi:uncharacterized protein TRIREDRAFT_107338 [Trichoderma reesei QM6a]|uniref:Predicted protein n=2 Tax=Hypocrea jecorina TaxID=51453 RepID=G0RJE0_HYPJQ|nr:uncharacterized protein TRIREDRAFT_107338 [Trichoderma reesei QM6a]EGR48573.1 predicted protein [Trichoderma reesei QM6a]ETS01465.1 hypothetical protein M419DRAFT_80759 [Trichoderma reesei RUT C-30]